MKAWYLLVCMVITLENAATAAEPTEGQQATIITTNVTETLIEVSGKQTDWKRTGLYVKRGQLLTLHIEGKISVGRDPKKHTGEYGKHLVLRAGDGASVEVYDKRGARVSANDEGELSFRINDSNYSDNAGQYTVRISSLTPMRKETRRDKDR